MQPPNHTVSYPSIQPQYTQASVSTATQYQQAITNQWQSGEINSATQPPYTQQQAITNQWQSGEINSATQPPYTQQQAITNQWQSGEINSATQPPYTQQQAITNHWQSGEINRATQPPYTQQQEINGGQAQMTGVFSENGERQKSQYYCKRGKLTELALEVDDMTYSKSKRTAANFLDRTLPSPPPTNFNNSMEATPLRCSTPSQVSEYSSQDDSEECSREFSVDLDSPSPPPNDANNKPSSQNPILSTSLPNISTQKPKTSHPFVPINKGTIFLPPLPPPPPARVAPNLTIPLVPNYHNPIQPGMYLNRGQIQHALIQLLYETVNK